MQKVSIVPRGRGALGYTLQAPLEDRYLMSEGELLGRMRTLLGGRAAEEIVFGEISTGASDDLEKASKIVRQMLTVYGMSKKLPNLSLVEGAQNGFLGQGAASVPHSAAIEQAIGDEMLQILRTAYEEAKALLTEQRAQLEALADPPAGAGEDRRAGPARGARAASDSSTPRSASHGARRAARPLYAARGCRRPGRPSRPRSARRSATTAPSAVVEDRPCCRPDR